MPRAHRRTDSPLGREFRVADLTAEPLLVNPQSSFEDANLERLHYPVYLSNQRSRSPSASRSRLAAEDKSHGFRDRMRADFSHHRPALHSRKESTVTFSGAQLGSSVVDVDQANRPSNHDRQMSGQSSASTVVDTRYVNMLLAMEEISVWYDVLAFFFTWCLLAGFIVLPGTLENLGVIVEANVGDEVLQKALNTLLDRIPLSSIATGLSAFGIFGMLCLWIRWMANYAWVVRNIFLPGCFNGLAGLLGTLINIYGVNQGHRPKFALTILVVVSSVTVVCLALSILYEYVLLERVKQEHVKQVGEHGTGRRGEGVLKPGPSGYTSPV